MPKGIQDRSAKWTFGYLNTSQDTADIEKIEGSVVKGLDLDKLALGSLESSSYMAASGAAKDFNNTQIGNRELRLNGGILEYKSQEGAFPWVPVQISPRPTSLSIIPNSDSISINDNDGDITGGITGTVPVPANYTPNDQQNIFRIEIDGNGSPDTFKWTLDNYPAEGDVNVPITAGTPQLLHFGVYVDFGQDTGHTIGEKGTITVVEDTLGDGEYFYAMTTAKIDGDDKIETLASDVVVFKINNVDNLGDRFAWISADVTFPDVPVGEEVWIYRKDPGSTEFIRVHVHTGAGGGTITWNDSTWLSFIIDPKIISIDGAKRLDTGNDDSLMDLVSSTGFSKIFEKNNRLFGVPNGREDLLLFTLPNEWWNWKLENSIVFNDDFVDIEELRDATSVDKTNTAVVFTAAGLYHVYGIGTDESPYERVTIDNEFGVIPNTVVRINNVVYCISNGSSYDDGKWGRKMYLYDLNALNELSGRVRETLPFVSDSVGINFVQIIGSDKLLVRMDSGDSITYHLKADGYGTTNATDETAGDWEWTGKMFHPLYSYSGKFENVDKFAIDYEGDVIVTFNIDGVDKSMPLSSVSRVYQEEFIPSFKGRKLYIKLVGTSNAKVYDFFIVRDV